MAIAVSGRGRRACPAASPMDSRAGRRYESSDCCSSPASWRTASSWCYNSCCTDRCNTDILVASFQIVRSSCCRRFGTVVLSCCWWRSSTTSKCWVTESSWQMEFSTSMRCRKTSKTVSSTAACCEIEKSRLVTQRRPVAQRLTCCNSCNNPACDRKRLNFV